MLQGDEWEEKWGEHYRAGGHTSKFADKWARDGPETWHERWGEDYDGNGGCVKWTDKVRLCAAAEPITAPSLCDAIAVRAGL